MHILRFVVIGLVGWAGCGLPLDPSSPTVDTARDAIVGGTVAQGDPAVVALIVSGGGQFCTGTLIGPRTVLTAAHCVYAYGRTPSYHVAFGTYSSQPTQTVAITAQHRHPSYNRSSHDLGILQLSQAVTNVVPIDINEVTLGSTDVGKQIRHVGFGVTHGSGGGSGTKREVTYLVRRVDATSIESGASGQQTCGGDSGGPAFMVTPGSSRERVAGVVSYGDQDCTQFGVDSRVDVDSPWIRSTMAPWEAPTCATDGKCLPGCTPVDQDCACAHDQQCNPQCVDLLKDPDCPRDCVRNGVCAQEVCPQPDVDCVELGGPCASASVCRNRQCVGDPQHAGLYCSRGCAKPSDCPSDMECGPTGVCRFMQKPVVDLGQPCAPSDYCRGGVCTGPAGGTLRCALECGSSLDCPSSESCEGGVDGTRYCRGADPAPKPTGKVVRLSAPPETLPAFNGCSSAGSGSVGLSLLLLVTGLRRKR